MDRDYRASAIRRLLRRVQQDPSGCWLYEGGIDHKGYGRFWMEGRNRIAHRAAYELLVGPIPDGLELDHTCRVRRCVNPQHLEPVTGKENLRRARGWSYPHRTHHDVTLRPTHCPQGHPYDEENTRVRVRRTGPRRECRTCNRERAKRYKRLRKEQKTRAIAA